jgi:hypothetical protein
MRQTTVLAALSALGAAFAQSNFTVDPNTIELTTRTEWCNAEFNTCGILCGGNTKANSCSPTDLKFVCTCSNGTAPGLEYYIQTMPTLLCEVAFSECIEKNTGNSQGQGKCKTDIKSKCGTLDPTKAQVGDGGSGSSSSSTTTAAPTGLGTTTAAGGAAPTSTSGAGAMPTLVGNGFAAVAAGVLAAALL